MKSKEIVFTGYNSELKENARNLRKNMTPEEKHLWYDFLRSYPVKFYRQRSIGNYIVDFYCSKAKLVIELDGSQHYTIDGKEYDSLRTEVLEAYGLEVLRVSNYDIKQNFEGVCITIDRNVKGKMTR